MNRQIRTHELFEAIPVHIAPLFHGTEYPWEVLPNIKNHIRGLIEAGMEDYTPWAEGVLVGKDVKIHPTATVEAPAILGAGTEVRAGALIRGAVITGKNCIIGNSTELKNCVLFDHVQVPHYNYVGDSVLGNHAHMGAGAICSNLKADGKSVIIHGEADLDTGLRKIGGILGDHADIGCGSVLNPGCIVGQNTAVYPLTALRGVYPRDAIVKSTREVVPRIPREGVEEGI